MHLPEQPSLRTDRLRLRQLPEQQRLLKKLLFYIDESLSNPVFRKAPFSIFSIHYDFRKVNRKRRIRQNIVNFFPTHFDMVRQNSTKPGSSYSIRYFPENVNHFMMRTSTKYDHSFCAFCRASGTQKFPETIWSNVSGIPAPPYAIYTIR